MNATPTQQPSVTGRRRRRLFIVAVVLVLLLAIAGLVATWLFFFGSEAPPAPSLDDALKILLPSASP